MTADAKLREAINKLAEEGAASLSLMIPDAKDEVSTIKISLARDVISLLTGRGLDLQFRTVNGEITIPAASLQGASGDVTMTIQQVKAAAQTKEIEGRANQAEVVLTATGGNEVTIIGRPVQIETNLQNREVELVLPLTGMADEVDPTKLGVYVEHSGRNNGVPDGGSCSVSQRQRVEIHRRSFQHLCFSEVGRSVNLYA